jgi:hypothetical protein
LAKAARDFLAGGIFGATFVDDELRELPIN